MKKNNKKSTTQNADAPQKKKITFPKVMLALAVAIVIGIGAVVVVDKLNDSVAKSVNIEGAYSEIYIGNPKFESVVYDVSVYPSTAEQGFNVYTSDANIASVSITEDNKIKITAVSVGRATITVQSLAKSSLVDTCVVDVKNTDVQNVVFVHPALNEDEEDEPIRGAVTMQKDGIEHYLYFNLYPIDANMDNLTISYDSEILESVTLDKENKRLVVIPKTDIENASTAVYLEINQDTDAGDRVVSKNIRMQINLVEREAYLAFEFASDASNRVFSSNHSGFVYLDPKNDGDPIDKRDISDFYVKVNMAYDKDFKNLGTFKMEDFIVKVNDKIIIDHDSTEDAYYYSKVENAGSADESEIEILKIEKINENGELFYKITASKEFEAEKYLRLTFEHYYTGAQGVVEVNFFDQNKLSEDKNKFNIAVNEYLKTGQTINFISATNSAYSISKGSETVMFTTYDAAINAGIIKAYPVDADGKECYLFENGSGEQISITQVSNRMKLSATSNVFNTQNTHDAITISFQWKYIYWDSRYIVNYGEEQKIDLNFYIEGVYFTANDDNVNSVTLSKTTAITVNIYSTLDQILSSNPQSYQDYFGTEDVKYSVMKVTESGVETSNEITITKQSSNGGFWSFIVDSTNASVGSEYLIIFEYCDMEIVIYGTL